MLVRNIKDKFSSAHFEDHLYVGKHAYSCVNGPHFSFLTYKYVIKTYKYALFARKVRNKESNIYKLYGDPYISMKNHEKRLGFKWCREGSDFKTYKLIKNKLF